MPSCLHVCMSVRLYACMHACMHVRVYVCNMVTMYVCMYVICIYVVMYLCINVFMYRRVCVHPRMPGCMYAWIRGWWMDARTEGRREGGREGWMDGCVYVRIYIDLLFHFSCVSFDYACACLHEVVAVKVARARGNVQLRTTVTF